MIKIIFRQNFFRIWEIEKNQKNIFLENGV